MIYIDKVSFKRIEAVQWTGENIYEISYFVRTPATCLSKCSNGSVRIHTRRGVLTVPKDGYITEEKVNGICRHEVYSQNKFEQAYEQKERKL